MYDNASGRYILCDYVAIQYDFKLISEVLELKNHLLAYLDMLHSVYPSVSKIRFYSPIMDVGRPGQTVT